jgi:hypothetical protein
MSLAHYMNVYRGCYVSLKSMVICAVQSTGLSLNGDENNKVTLHGCKASCFVGAVVDMKASTSATNVSAIC